MRGRRRRAPPRPPALPGLGHPLLLATLELLERFGPEGARLLHGVAAEPPPLRVCEVPERGARCAGGALVEGPRQGGRAPQGVGEGRARALVGRVAREHVEALHQGRTHHPQGARCLAPDAQGGLLAPGLHRGSQRLGPGPVHREPVALPCGGGVRSAPPGATRAPPRPPTSPPRGGQQEAGGAPPGHQEASTARGRREEPARAGGRSLLISKRERRGKTFKKEKKGDFFEASTRKRKEIKVNVVQEFPQISTTVYKCVNFDQIRYLSRRV